MDNTDTILLLLIFVVLAYMLIERYRLKDYNVPSDDLPEGVVLRTYCRKTTHVQIVSDGEGYSRPIKTPNARQCGYKT